MNSIRCLLVLVLTSCAAFSQTPPARPEFEVASVKVSTQPPMQLNQGVHVDGAMVSYTAATLRDFIRWAYLVKQNQISGPDWIAADRYDIVAKLPSGATRDQIPAMLQALLEDRFKLKVHRDTKEFSVYALVVAKGGIKMTESAPEPVTDDDPATKSNVDVSVTMGNNGAAVSLGKGSSMTFDARRITAKKITMSYLADSLARFEDRPVVDMTGLKGNYDFTLDYNFDDLRAVILSSAPPGTPLPPKQEGDPGVSLMDSLMAAGLRLEPRKAPLEMIVVDHAEKTPTVN